MSKSKKTPRPPPLEATLRELADLADVPEPERASFFKDVLMYMQTAREQLELAARWTEISGNADKFWRHARSLHEMLSALGTTETELIEGVLSKGKSLFSRFSNDGIRGMRETAYQQALLFSLLAGKPDPSFPSQTPALRKRGKSPGGRPKGAV